MSKDKDKPVIKDLAKSLKELIQSSNAQLVGIRKVKTGTEFYVYDNALSILPTNVKTNLTNIIVNAEALLAAVSQNKGELYLEKYDSVIETASAKLTETNVKIGKAILTGREPIDLPDIVENVTLLPEEVVTLIQARFNDTFVPKNPKSIFGWELVIRNKSAYYGSANGPQAIVEEATVDCKDFTIRFPHDTCLLMTKLTKSIDNIGICKTAIVLYNEGVEHYIPNRSENVEITIDTVSDLIDSALVTTKPCPVSDRLQHVISFAEKEDKILFNVKENELIASVKSKSGENESVISKVDLPNTSFSITHLQAMPMTDYKSLQAEIGIATEAKSVKVRLMYLCYKIVKGSKSYLHYYIVSASH
jgi:hypothetical protein